MIIILLKGLITPLTSTYEPPSRHHQKCNNMVFSGL